MHNGISVVIPNYNGSVLLPQVLPTVFTALDEIKMPFEVLVADDCSVDDSVQMLRNQFPQVRVIENKVNSGFSVTANYGIRQARYDLVLLLNSDVKLEPGYFQHLLHYFDAADTFGVMGRIIGWDDENIQDGAKYPSFHHAKIKTSVNYLLENEEEMKDGIYTVYLSGANALLDRKKFLHIGGFNEMFSPFYVEDYEFSMRAWRLGFCCYYEHRAICRHRTSTTINTGNRKNYIKMIYNRNKWFLHAIHLLPARRILWLIQLIPEILVQSLLMKKYYLQAFRHFLFSQKAIRQSRNEINRISGGHLLSVEDVVKKIREPIKNKKLIFFRSG